MIGRLKIFFEYQDCSKKLILDIKLLQLIFYLIKELYMLYIVSF